MNLLPDNIEIFLLNDSICLRFDGSQVEQPVTILIDDASARDLAIALVELSTRSIASHPPNQLRLFPPQHTLPALDPNATPDHSILANWQPPGLDRPENVPITTPDGTPSACPDPPGLLG